MAITNAFRSAVAAGNVIGIRIMMKDSLLADPTFAEFNEMAHYAQTVSGLYDAHDGRELEDDKNAWNDDYMNKLMVQVVGNFSPDRIERLKQIVSHLRKGTSRQSGISSRSNISSSNGTSNIIGSSRTGSGGGNTGNYPFRHEPSGRPSQTWRPSPQQRMGARNNQLRIPRIAVGAVAGGIVVGAATAIAGGSFIARAAAGAIIVGAVVWAATNRR